VVTIKRVPELVPEEIAKRSGMKLNQPAPIATVDARANDDAISFATPMRNFLDQTGALQGRQCDHEHWHPSMGSGNDHHLVPRRPTSSGNAFPGPTKMDEITGGSPSGGSTMAGADGWRQRQQARRCPPSRQ